jgi:hypothetical protein
MKMPVKRNARTHFEQIPVEVVKKIAVEKGPEKEATKPKNGVAELPSRKTEPYSMPISSLRWTGH